MPFITINNDRTRDYLYDVYKDNNCIFFYFWNDCGHCLQFKPVFNNVIQELRQTQENFMKKAIIFQIELDNFHLLPNELKDVHAFPSVVTYSNGEKINEFKEQRTKNNLSNFILSSLGESSKTYNGTSKTKTKKVIRKYPKSV
jgi:thiol-disulfide isomerase/thioredoxin